MMYFANKGLFVRELGDNAYVIQDVFGTCSLPFQSSEEELDRNTNALAKIQKLVTIGLDSECPDLSDFRWNELEHYYIAQIDGALLSSIVNREQREKYHSVIGLFPIGYLECGFGDGSKKLLECIHSKFTKLCNEKSFPIQERDLDLFLVTSQVERICSDIMSLVSRSITAYIDLLRCHRRCIERSYQAIDQLRSKEIVHRGSDSYQAASAVTSLVIALCSSLDLSAKLIQYVNSIDANKIAFKAARCKQYYELRQIKPQFISGSALNKIVGFQKSNAAIPEIIQFRNDLIHSTSAIELERIYVGIETDEINNMPLYYSVQYARDCLDSGQPVRFLGRNYFVEGKLDIEVKALSWIHEVIDYHISVAKEIYSYLIAVEKPNE